MSKPGHKTRTCAQHLRHDVLICIKFADTLKVKDIASALEDQVLKSRSKPALHRSSLVKQIATQGIYSVASVKKQGFWQKARRCQYVHASVVLDIMAWNSHPDRFQGCRDCSLAAEEFMAVVRRAQGHFSVPQPQHRPWGTKIQKLISMHIKANTWKIWDQNSMRLTSIIIFGTLASSMLITIARAMSYSSACTSELTKLSKYTEHRTATANATYVVC